jgi:hypothetical protein
MNISGIKLIAYQPVFGHYSFCFVLFHIEYFVPDQTLHLPSSEAENEIPISVDHRVVVSLDFIDFGQVANAEEEHSASW